MNQEQPILRPLVEDDDINQEAELLKLFGKKPNKTIIYRRLQGAQTLTYDFTSEIEAEEPDWPSHLPDPQIIEDLANWSLQQSSAIQNRMWAFLEDPTDEKVDQILEELVELSLITKAMLPPTKEVSLETLILNELKHNDRSIEELYEFRSFIHSNRPEAAIRQAVRRLTRKGKITRRPEEDGKFTTRS